jgi:L-threonylcarbamoyladenylate synthase
MIKDATGIEPDATNKVDTKASGLLESHYSPSAKVILDQIPKPGDGFIALSNIKTPQGVLRLAEPKNNIEYAKLLYQALRDGDEKQLKTICAQLPTGDDIAEAIRDRLFKAAEKNN